MSVKELKATYPDWKGPSEGLSGKKCFERDQRIDGTLFVVEACVEADAVSRIRVYTMTSPEVLGLWVDQAAIYEKLLRQLKQDYGTPRLRTSGSHPVFGPNEGVAWRDMDGTMLTLSRDAVFVSIDYLTPQAAEAQFPKESDQPSPF